MSSKSWPPLYGKASNGKIKIWKTWVESTRDNNAIIFTDHGLEDGEIQRATNTIISGKNIGRSNETTSFEQACSEAESNWNKKQDKKYVVTKAELEQSSDPLPMLALNFKKRGKDINWPALLQPKLNGIRCLATKTGRYGIKYTSRGGKYFTTLKHLTLPLLKAMEVGEVFDGELFTRELTFQQITSAVKKEQESTLLLEYWIYDVIQDRPFVDRTKYLSDKGMPMPLVTVPTLVCKNEDQMKKMHQQFMAAEYEGTIIRNFTGVYKVDFRSADLQKYKDFIDMEFEITGGKQGKGKDEGTVIFICVQEDGETFDCRPKGTHAQRQKYWEELPSLIGKQLTVRYQTRTDANIPLFPVGIAIRDYE